MSDDSDFRRERTTSAVYLKVIEEQLSTLRKSGLIFMQDDVSIHTAHMVKRLFNNSAIEMMN